MSNNSRRGYWTAYAFVGILENGTKMSFASYEEYLEYMEGEDE